MSLYHEKLHDDFYNKYGRETNPREHLELVYQTTQTDYFRQATPQMQRGTIVYGLSFIQPRLEAEIAINGAPDGQEKVYYDQFNAAANSVGYHLTYEVTAGDNGNNTAKIYLVDNKSGGRYNLSEAMTAVRKAAPSQYNEK